MIHISHSLEYAEFLFLPFMGGKGGTGNVHKRNEIDQDLSIAYAFPPRNINKKEKTFCFLSLLKLITYPAIA